MPVDATFREPPLYQREQYAKGGLGRIYWDYRDRVVLSFLGKTDVSVADIGCGEGITLERIERRFPYIRCLGVDRIPENLFICSGQGLPVIGASVYDLPIPNDTFDYVLFLDVIEHLNEPERAIGEIKRILKPAGTLIMIFPHDFLFLIARLVTFKFREAFFDPGHVRRWTPQDMGRFLDNCGFHIVRERNIPFLFWCLSFHHLVVCRKEH